MKMKRRGGGGGGGGGGRGWLKTKAITSRKRESKQNKKDERKINDLLE